MFADSALLFSFSLPNVRHGTSLLSILLQAATNLVFPGNCWLAVSYSWTIPRLFCQFYLVAWFSCIVINKGLRMELGWSVSSGELLNSGSLITCREYKKVPDKYIDIKAVLCLRQLLFRRWELWYECLITLIMWHNFSLLCPETNSNKAFYFIHHWD